MQIGDILSMNAYRFPDKIALISGEGNISYRQLEKTANQIASALIGIGVKKGKGCQ
jgi:non-ribosomal peptide synthetase component E (peptide arylation enzyme)